MRTDISGARLTNNLVAGNRMLGSVLASATGAAIVLQADHPDFIRLLLGAAAAVRLPAPSAALRGRMFTVLNESTGANTATMQTSTGGALPVASTVVRHRMKQYVCNGSLWYSDSSN